MSVDLGSILERVFTNPVTLGIFILSLYVFNKKLKFGAILTLVASAATSSLLGYLLHF